MSKGVKHKGVVAWFAQNSVAANILMIALLIGGLFVIDKTNSEVLISLFLSTQSKSKGSYSK